MRKLAVGIALFASLTATRSHALLIDDFGDGDFSITDTTDNVSAVLGSQGSLSGVLGGARDSAINLQAGTSANLAVAGGSATVSAALLSVAWANLNYDGLAGAGGSLGVDLTADGADRFVVEVSALSAVGAGPGFSVRVTDSDSASVVELGSVSSTGSYEFLFSAFSGIDFTDVRVIGLHSLGGVAPADGESISFGSFATVPEPSTGILVGVGLLALAATRRRPAGG
jgi:hypothetical protein